LLVGGRVFLLDYLTQEVDAGLLEVVQGIYDLLKRAGVLRWLGARPQLHSPCIPHRSLPQVDYAASAAAGCRCSLLRLHVDVLDILGLLLTTTLSGHLVGIRVSFTPTDF